MRKAILCLTVLLLLTGLAYAKTDTSVRPDDTSEYISEGDYGYPIDLLLDRLGCGIPVNEAGEPVFDARCRQALEDWQYEHGLETTGCFDSDTLCLLLGCEPDGYEVWIPMHGGEKYHNKPTCSHMLYPCRMPLDCAEALGYTACKKCF